MTKIITANDIAQRDGHKFYIDWVKMQSIRVYNAGRIPAPWNGKLAGKPIKARIDFGRWIADCPYCNGAEYVEPTDPTPVFYCLSCGMSENGYAALPVKFPKNREEIERLLLLRPVSTRYGSNDIEKALRANPIIAGYGRSWNPEETALDIRRQNDELLKKVSEREY